MHAERRAHLFVILVGDRDDALGLARLLSGLARHGGDGAADFVVPPVTGVRFFSDESAQAQLDTWWADTVRPNHVPVYLVDHEPGLPEWLNGVDGHFYIRLPTPEVRDLYPPPRTTPFVGSHPLEYARLVMRDYSRPPAPIFSAGEAARMTNLVTSLGTTARSSHEAPICPSPRVPTVRWPGGSPNSVPTHSAFASGTKQRPGRDAASPGAPGWRSPLRKFAAGAAILPFRSSSRTEMPTRGLARDALRRSPTIAVVGSRKGGVGKTSHAAGVAIQAGQLLDLVGHTACLVDANIANPDAWGQMNLPVRAATVRQVVTALASNREPPLPVHAQTPALACYPESREASDYSKTDIDRFATFLRLRYTLIVVDMSNRLPDPLGGPEAAVAAYWLNHADVLVLPTTASVADFNGVLDYLELSDLPPVVVPYLVPKGRLNREHRVTRAYLEAIRTRVERVVEVPDLADKVRLAGMEKVPVERVSPALRNAYRRVTEAVIAAPLRRHDTGEGIDA